MTMNNEKLEKILEELKIIKSYLVNNNTLHLQSSLNELYEAVNPVTTTPNLAVFKELPDMIFNAVSKRHTKGLILQTSLAITEDRNQHWFMSNAFYEEITDTDDYEEIEKLIQTISSQNRIRILHLIFGGKHQFKDFKELGIADATLNHHLKYLVKHDVIMKKERKYYLTSFGTHLLFFALGLKKSRNK